jgi:hypothetical protein
LCLGGIEDGYDGPSGLVFFAGDYPARLAGLLDGAPLAHEAVAEPVTSEWWVERVMSWGTKDGYDGPSGLSFFCGGITQPVGLGCWMVLLGRKARNAAEPSRMLDGAPLVHGEAGVGPEFGEETPAEA